MVYWHRSGAHWDISLRSKSQCSYTGLSYFSTQASYAEGPRRLTHDSIQEEV
jgi:hypothetical protein